MHGRICRKGNMNATHSNALSNNLDKPQLRLSLSPYLHIICFYHLHLLLQLLQAIL